MRSSKRLSTLLRIIIAVIVLLGLIVGAAILIPGLYLNHTRDMQPVTLDVGNVEIQGYLYPGIDVTTNWVIFVHGNRAEGQSSPLYQVILNNLSTNINILAIDLYGFGQSALIPDANETNFDRSRDVQAAASYLQETYNVSPEQITLMGHSLGASQIVQAAKETTYHKLVSIGPGDYSLLVDDPQVFADYVNKLEQNTGEAPPEDALRGEITPFTPQMLYAPCPSSPFVLVGGQYEHADGLFTNQGKIPSECLANFEVVTIPLSNHMYGTEGTYLPGPLSFLHRVVDPIHSGIELSLLVNTLNQILA